MILAIGWWIFLFTLCQGKYIEVNNEGNESSSCCIEGACLCGSLYEALLNVENDTVINITSSLVTLHDVTHMGSGHNNITIIGNEVTVACNDSGSLDCLYCSNVVIKGITWEQCGDPTNPYIRYAIGFGNVVNASIIGCTFQYCKVCTVVMIYMLQSGFVQVHDGRFLFNHIINSSQCTAPAPYASLLILDGEYQVMEKAYVSVTRTIFYHNGPYGYFRYSSGYAISSAALMCIFNTPRSVKLDVESVTVSTTFGLGGNFLFSNTYDVTLQFTNVNFFNNSNGGSSIQLVTSNTLLNNVQISSTNYTNNDNGALKFLIVATGASRVTLHRVMIMENRGTYPEDFTMGNGGNNQGVGMLVILHNMLTSTFSVAYCNVYDNIGSDSSTVYIESNDNQVVSVVSSNFTNNVGPALHLSNCAAEFKGYTLFMNNSAGRGAAMYLHRGSQIAIRESSAVEFHRNIAEQQGGAIYIELSFGCPHNGIIITDLSNTSSVLFTDNSAGIAGNSIYFNIPHESCDVIRETLIYKFNYSQPPGLIGPPIATSPYKVNLCSISCDLSNKTDEICHVPNRNMLGQSVDINAVVCDYYGSVSETVQFYIECTNCNDAYRLSSNSRILVNQGSFDVTFLAVDADSDIVDNTNVTLSLSSVLSDEYRQLTATVSIELSSCQSGYVFDPNHQRCVCYEQSKDIIRCQHDYAEIKHGYWFGVAIPSKHTISLCPIYYCNFNEVTSNGYYKLSEEVGDQCSSRRTGVACGECKSGYTLAYDSPDCINVNKCYTGMTIIMVALTILYWIMVVALVFGLMQRRISLGYIYGLIYYYSIIDILLGSNLYISDGVFQLVTILSSFAKLTPQFLGNFCFLKGLSGIDQQFVHYFHGISVFSLIGVIVIAARYSPRISKVVRHCIIRVICLLILLSYTSLASTSLQLLRPLYFDDVNGAYVYSSPSIKYFTGRHIAYGIIALLCGLFIVIGLPLLLLLEPFLKGKVNFIRIKPLLDQYQECYKDQYHWFAAYYLVCRLVIIAIVYVSNFNNGLYYLQTACIIIVMTHAWIKPYKSETLNIIDGEILLIPVFVVNLNSFTFSRSLTIFLFVLAVLFPLVLSGFTFVKIQCSSIFKKKEGTDGPEEMQLVAGSRQLQSGPYRFQDRNNGFAGVSSSQESLVRLMEALIKVEN